MLEKFEPCKDLPRCDEQSFIPWSKVEPLAGMEFEFYRQAADGSRSEITRAMLRNIPERKGGHIFVTSDPMIISESGELIGWVFQNPEQIFWRMVSIIYHD